MIEKIQYGPVEFLPPVGVSRAILEISGVKASKRQYTTYVFLDDVHGEEIEALIEAYNYAGCFYMLGDTSGTVRLDITRALNIALETMPNFHISFLTQCNREDGDDRYEPVFGFEHLDILHTFPEDTDFEVSACVEHHY